MAAAIPSTLVARVLMLAAFEVASMSGFLEIGDLSWAEESEHENVNDKEILP